MAFRFHGMSTFNGSQISKAERKEGERLFRPLEAAVDAAMVSAMIGAVAERTAACAALLDVGWFGLMLNKHPSCIANV